MIAFSCLGSMSKFYFLLSVFLYFMNILLQGGITFIAQGRNKDVPSVLERKNKHIAAEKGG